LAKQIFGADKDESVDTYVKKVFEEFDTDDSGELSYEGKSVNINFSYSAYALIVTPLIDTFSLIDTLFWVIFLPP